MLDISNWHGEAGKQILPAFSLIFGAIDGNGKVPVQGHGSETLFYGEYTINGKLDVTEKSMVLEQRWPGKDWHLHIEVVWEPDRNCFFGRFRYSDKKYWRKYRLEPIIGSIDNRKTEPNYVR